MADEEVVLTDEEYQELEDLETERERLAKEEQPRLPQDELEAQLYAENAEAVAIEPNPDEPEPDDG